ncbi:MAG: diheme cytochrome c-553 [Candidatus Zixiibacteriota bacterium]
MFKRTLIVVGVLVALMAIAYSQTKTTQNKVAAVKEVNDHGALVKRGEFLVRMGSCADCHCPKKMSAMGPVPDSSRWLSGHPADAKVPPVPANVLSMEGWIGMTNMHLTAWAGPWGISYAANITPDEATGIGNWTEEVFIKTMKTGKHMGAGREILPPMPWQTLSTLSDSDLKAIFAYLLSCKPILNEVPQPEAPAGH